MSAKTVLVTFDVDGTLIKSVGADANKFHKDAFTAAFKEVYGELAALLRVSGCSCPSFGVRMSKSLQQEAKIRPFVTGIDTNIDVIHHHGCTDRQVRTPCGNLQVQKFAVLTVLTARQRR